MWKRSNYPYCHPPSVTLRRHRTTTTATRPLPAATNHRRAAIGPPSTAAGPQANTVEPPPNPRRLLLDHRRMLDCEGRFWKWTKFSRKFNLSTKRPKIPMRGKTILEDNISGIKIPNNENWNSLPNPPLSNVLISNFVNKQKISTRKNVSWPRSNQETNDLEKKKREKN